MLAPPHPKSCVRHWQQLIQAETRIWTQTLSFVNSATLKCAVQLGVFDAIHNHGKPMALTDLVGALQIKPEKARGIGSLMCVLVRNSFLAKNKISDNDPEEGDDDDGGYMLTPASRLLLQDDIYSIKPYVLFHLDPICTKSWDYMAEWFQNDDSTPFHTANGKSFWDYHASDTRIQKVFDETMETDSRLTASLILKEECKGVFQGLTSLVDVGGGTGTMTRAIAQTFPNLKCTVFDQPHVIANLQGSRNLDFVGGDMFQSIPPGNAILFKWILHDWNDEDCVKILNKCKEAIPSREGGKIIIIDIVIVNQYDKSEIMESQVMFDMGMMVWFGAKERNLKEWDKLFSDASFSHYEITNVFGSRSLIELYP